MNPIFYAFAILLFLAVVLALEGGYQWWNNRHGASARRLESRIRALSAGGQVHKERLTILKDRMLSDSKLLDRLLMQVPRIQTLDLLIVQAGLKWSIARFAGTSLAFSAAVFAAATLASIPMTVAAPGALAGLTLPLVYLARRRSRRLRQLERQLPDAADMISRALRAGHAFSGAIGMVSTEFAEPMAGEFRITFDEISYGVSLNEALMNFATRVPIRDLRYFVIAVLIQRETGGNLAEVLDSIAVLIRERLKLFDKIRVLSAEGRLSAWVLGLLPFGAAGMMMAVNPSFLAVLWQDPAGVTMLETVLASMVFGLLWMRQIVKIRV